MSNLTDLYSSEVSDHESESPPAKKPKFGLQGLIEKHRQECVSLEPQSPRVLTFLTCLQYGNHSARNCHG